MGTRMDIERQLRDAAKRSGSSIKQLAGKSDIPYSALHRFLVNDRGITLRSAAKLARVLGLELRPIIRRKRK
jgi:plasmid maintenance system antidote protein VapI